MSIIRKIGIQPNTQAVTADLVLTYVPFWRFVLCYVRRMRAGGIAEPHHRHAAIVSRRSLASKDDLSLAALSCLQLPSSDGVSGVLQVTGELMAGFSARVFLIPLT